MRERASGTSANVAAAEVGRVGRSRHAAGEVMAHLPDAPFLRRAHDGAMSDTDGTAPDTSRVELLITLGRDREAVAAATAQQKPAQLGGTMDGAQQLDQLMPLLHGLVDRISPEQLDDRTPCANFTVTGVLEHMIGGAGAFSPMLRGQTPPASADAQSTTGTLQDRWRAAMIDLLDAVHCEGAADRTIASPFGEVPGAVFMRFVAFDGLVHGWDLATATNQRYAPPDDLVREVDAFARQAVAPGMRNGDTFAAETEAPAHSGVMEQLVAFSGRQVTRKATR
jgi:uncharacterized protein (TIGR03086 family)